MSKDTSPFVVTVSMMIAFTITHVTMLALVGRKLETRTALTL